MNFCTVHLQMVSLLVTLKKNEKLMRINLGVEKNGGLMAITIKRKTSWIGTGSTIALYINGKKEGKISNHEETQVNLESQNARLRVSQLGGKSNEIEVADGQTVEITTTKVGVILFYLFFLSMFVTGLVLQDITSKLISVAALFTLFCASYFYVEQFQLKVVEAGTKTDCTDFSE